ncbi:MAG: hydroxymethylglutaryl-CoA reductase, degradative [Bacteroidales bacterium]
MKNTKFINGFSKMSKHQQLRAIWKEQELKDNKELLSRFEVNDPGIQKRFESFSENTISNFHLPFGIAPNFLIDQTLYHIPMAIEESSVVAAASRSARFWYDKGGFQTEFIKTLKTGQIHFSFTGNAQLLYKHLEAIKYHLHASAKPLLSNMEQRGGGIQSTELFRLRDIHHSPHKMQNDYQLMVTFETVDSMGANLINSCLEAMGRALMQFISTHDELNSYKHELIMAILSNYTPQSIIRMKLEAPTDTLNGIAEGMSGKAFAEKFQKAVYIAQHDIFRATTHNKGIMNGVDAVVIATANDFRAVEAAAHAYASRKGQYSSLSNCSVSDNIFSYELEIPLSIGTVGGLTGLHPLAKLSLQLLGNPGARELMKVIAAAGLANNFGALRALITEGIQQGHMKMHLDNILLQYQANAEEREKAKAWFRNKTITHANVKTFLDELRN